MSRSPAKGGIGLGLRWEFAEALLERHRQRPTTLDFLEIAPENYLGRGGAARRTLERAAAAFPLVTHGLSMSLGGRDALDIKYLDALSAFVSEIESPWHSDHACMSAEGGRMLHDLLPIPLSVAQAVHTADRIRWARDRLRRPLAIENVSFYAHAGAPDLTEPRFIREVCERADCGWLFDVNNAIVNARNFGLDPEEWLRDAPLERVVQIHVAGHEWFDVGGGEMTPVSERSEPGESHAASAAPADRERVAIDTHGAPVDQEVYALLEAVLVRTGPVPIVLERDQNFPGLDALLDEVDTIRALSSRAEQKRRSA